MAFVAKELGRLVAGLGQRAKGAPRSIAVEDVAGGPFFFIPVKVKRVIFKTLIIFDKIIITRSFYKKVI